MTQARVSKDRKATVASRNLVHSSELAVLVPIKAGLVEIPNPMTYARRLELLLEALFDLRKEGVEKSRGSFVGPLEQLQTIHNVHWCILDDDAPTITENDAATRPLRPKEPSRTKKLLLMVAFDQPWEPYIRVIVDKAGPLLDLIFCHCEGFDDSSSQHGYENFARYVRKAQRDCQYYASAHPELTVDDQRYLRQFRDLQAGCPAEELPLRAVVEPIAPCRPAQDEGDRLFRLLGELYRTRNMFPEKLGGSPTGNPMAIVSNDPPRTGQISDRDYYDAAAELLIRGFLPTDRDQQQFTVELLFKFVQRLGANYRGLGAWYHERLERIHGLKLDEKALRRRQARETRKEVMAKLQPGLLSDHKGELADDEAEEDDEQPRPRSEHKGMTHGCLVMFQFRQQGDFGEVARCIEEFAGRVGKTPLGKASDSAAEPYQFDVAFTYSGLEKLFDNETLRELPVEFQVGMEARAGLLGDLGDNHPSQWSLPRVNFPMAEGARSVDGSDIEVPLSAVDMVVLIQCHRDIPAKVGDSEDLSYTWSQRHPLYSHVEELDHPAVRILHVEPLRRYTERRVPGTDLYREHFGYIDGLSQPKPFEPNTAPRAERAALGDFLLGRIDSRGEPSPKPSHTAFEDGSFLVVRKLAQNVKAFTAFVDEGAALLGVSRETLRSKLMGRRDDGKPLATNAVCEAGDNGFDYDEDRDGLGCPLQAHIRRANPRTPERPSVHGRPTQTPRLMRRGFPYGPKDGDEHERGLLFMAYNANIAEQFEVIQRWINSANITGLYGDLNDPIVGASASARRRRFSFRTEQGVKATALDTTFVKLQWGMYLFVPSIVGLRRLAEQAAAASQGNLTANRIPAKERIDRGRRLIAELEDIERHPAQGGEVRAIEGWKKLLEDEAFEEDARAVWEVIRSQKGYLPTPYGFLVGSKELALKVLTDESAFSVSGYYARMKASLGAMHLGMDSIRRTEANCAPGFDPAYMQAFDDGEIDYAKHSKTNAEIASITRREAFDLAYEHTRYAFKAARRAAKASCETRLTTLDLALLGERVVSLVSSDCFGFPEASQLPENVDPRHEPAPDTLLISGHPTHLADQRAYCPDDFTVAAQYIFRPRPDVWAQQAAKARGERIQSAADAFLTRKKGEAASSQKAADDTKRAASGSVAVGDAKPHDSERARKFLEFVTTTFHEPAAQRQALVGAVDGFVGATYGSFGSILDRWLEDSELGGLSLEFQEHLARTTQGKPASQLAPEDVFSTALEFETRIEQTLKRRLVPLWIFRTATRQTQLGDIEIDVGTQVIINLGSAAADVNGPVDDKDMIFGGARRASALAKAAQHGCPHRPGAEAAPRAVACTCGGEGEGPSDGHAADCPCSPRAAVSEAALADVAQQLQPGPGTTNYPIHACPGREMAMGTLLGMISAILVQKNLRRESRLLVSFGPR